MKEMIDMVQRFNGIDFSGMTKEDIELFLLNECFKNGFSLNETQAIMHNVGY